MLIRRLWYWMTSARRSEALPLIQQAAAIDQARLGAGHPFIADDLFDLGLVYDGLKRAADLATSG